MAELITRTHVRCPVSESGERIDAFFRERRRDGDDAARFALAVDVARSAGLPRANESTFTVHIVACCQWLAAFPSYHIAWDVDNEGRRAATLGRLDIEADEDYTSFFLRLAGSYETPRTSVRSHADPAFEHELAKATSGTLLLAIARSVERAYRNSEREKIAQRSATSRGRADTAGGAR